MAVSATSGGNRNLRVGLYALALGAPKGLGLLTEWVLNRTPLPAHMRILQLPPEFQGIVVITASA